jgi:hypothetical protein
VSGAVATALLVCGWISTDGTISFTDSSKRVPAAYQDVAICATLTDGLEGYARFTRDDHPFVPKAAFEDAPGSTIADEEVVEVHPKTAPERRRKRHRSERS